MSGGPHYIAVAGNMGSGKSSLVRWLCQQFGLLPFFEPHDENPYLADFYADMRRWAFHSQLYFLSRRFRIHRQLDGERRPVVQDRTLYEDAEIFAAHLHEKGYFDERDWQTYHDVYVELRKSIRTPSLMIYLRCELSTLRKRIRQRGRAYEQAISADYLRSLHRLYERWFSGYALSPTLVIETDRLDYATRLFDRHELIEAIRQRLG